MKKLKIITFCSSLLILFFSCATKPDLEKTNPEKNSQEEKQNFSDYKEIHILEEFYYLNCDIKYPEFTGKNAKKMNALCGNSLKSYYESFKNSAQKEWTKINQINLENGNSENIPPFEFKTEYDVCEGKIENGEKTTSVIIQTYIFSGGAHGNSILSANTFNSDGIKISLAQASKLTYQEISEKCRDSLYKNLKYQTNENDRIEWINRGTQPFASNFEIFKIDGKKITVYFDRYTVAPYYCGVQKVEF